GAEDHGGDLRQLRAQLLDPLLSVHFAIHGSFRPQAADPVEASTSARSIGIPGPIVEVSVTRLMYLPLAAAGLALTMAASSAWAFSAIFGASNSALPMGEWMMAVLSSRNSTLPALISRTAWATSKVTVPVFGLGMRPRGPSTLPSLPAERIMSGVAITASKSIQPSRVFRPLSSPPTRSAPASRASRTLSPPAMTRTRLVLPRPWGSTTVPRI